MNKPMNEPPKEHLNKPLSEKVVHDIEEEQQI
jgi:hypothetical protein